MNLFSIVMICLSVALSLLRYSTVLSKIMYTTIYAIELTNLLLEHFRNQLQRKNQHNLTRLCSKIAVLIASVSDVTPNAEPSGFYIAHFSSAAVAVIPNSSGLIGGNLQVRIEALWQKAYPLCRWHLCNSLCGTNVFLYGLNIGHNLFAVITPWLHR